jgi:tetratricopeptide (TPR) repeat protein
MGPVPLDVSITPGQAPCSGEHETTELGAEPVGDASAAAPARIGPYVVLERLGAGGMGVVYAAWDPRLHRKLAVKVIGERAGSRVRGAAPRLAREARALARLTHPNVVAVYDVGTLAEGRVYVAMELVDGVTLRRWQRATVRSIGEIVDMYVHAGRGLAAAHARGLVHRDFKPDNVLVDAEGRVRVLDFGLAIGLQDPHVDADDTIESHASEPTARLTATGVVIGTPAYMAPEQLRNRPVDARADQFAFCVALYEAIFGRRPFAGRSIGELADAIALGEIGVPPEARAMPRWLRRALVRGLKADPADRFASMDALLSALVRGRQRGLGRVAMLGLAGAALGAAILGGVGSPARLDHCTTASARVESAWSSGTRARVRDAVLGTEVGYAAETWSRVEAGLDDYARAWKLARREACEADMHAPASTPGVVTAAGRPAVDLRIRCLEHRLDAMTALVDVLARTDASTVARADATIGKLPRIEECDDPDEVLAWQHDAADPARAGAAQALRHELATAAALEWSGRFADGLPVAEEVASAAERGGLPAVEAEARRQLGMLRYRTGDYSGAEAEMTRAVWLATQEGRDRVAALAMVELVGLVGYMQARTEEGVAWSRHARATQARFAASPIDRARLTSSLGALHYRAGEYATAEGHYQEARALLSRESDAEGRHELSNALNNLGNVLAQLGRFEEAHQHLSRSVQIAESLRGPTHPDLATPLANLANLQIDRGDTDAALALHERALRIRQDALGEEHPLTASSWMNLGTTLNERGDARAARDAIERALELKRRGLGPDHPDVAHALNNLGETLRELGLHDEAIAAHRESLAIWSSAQGETHPYVAYPVTNLGLDLLAKGDLPGAREQLERALAIPEIADLDPALRGTAGFGLARVLERMGEPASVTRPLAARARADLDGRTRRYDTERAELDAWLSAHPG